MKEPNSLSSLLTGNPCWQPTEARIAGVVELRKDTFRDGCPAGFNVTEPACSPARDRRLLIVDRLEFVVETWSAIFQKSLPDVTVWHTSDPWEAVQLVEGWNPTVALLDYSPFAEWTAPLIYRVQNELRQIRLLVTSGCARVDLPWQIQEARFIPKAAPLDETIGALRAELT